MHLLFHPVDLLGAKVSAQHFVSPNTNQISLPRRTLTLRMGNIPETLDWTEDLTTTTTKQTVPRMWQKLSPPLRPPGQQQLPLSPLGSHSQYKTQSSSARCSPSSPDYPALLYLQCMDLIQLPKSFREPSTCQIVSAPKGTKSSQEDHRQVKDYTPNEPLEAQHTRKIQAPVKRTVCPAL